jgi:CRP-like cAMP-binding protein
MDQLVAFIERYTPVSIELVQELERLVVKETIEKNGYILKANQVCSKVWFLNRGMVRKFYLDPWGNEVTIWIHFENEMITSLNSFFNQKPSTENIQACEKSELISISYSNSNMLSKYPQMEAFTRRHLQQQFACIDEVSKKFSLLDAKGKYEMLSQIAPELIKRAKLGHIASIMGVTPETLSRIRTKK